MKRDEFLTELRSKLTGLADQDIEERVAYYNEMIDARVQYGLPEEQAVNEIGPVDGVVQLIMSEIPLTTLVTQRTKPRGGEGFGKFLLIMLTLPVWLPLIIAFGAVALALYTVVWAIVFVFYVVVLAFAIVSIAGFVVSVPFFFNGNFAGGVFLLGLGIFFAGATLLMFALSGGITKLVLMLTKGVMLGIKGCFVGKKGQV